MGKGKKGGRGLPPFLKGKVRSPPMPGYYEVLRCPLSKKEENQEPVQDPPKMAQNWLNRSKKFLNPGKMPVLCPFCDFSSNIPPGDESFTPLKAKIYAPHSAATTVPKYAVLLICIIFLSSSLLSLPPSLSLPTRR